ncbi:unnamed protein product, partial [Symbiodinium pilosum]
EASAALEKQGSDQSARPVEYSFDLCLVDVTWAGARFRQLQQGTVAEEELSPTVQAILADTLRWLRQRGGCQLHAFIGHTVVHGANTRKTMDGGLEPPAFAFDNYTEELVRGLNDFSGDFRQAKGPRLPVTSPLG